MDLDGDRSTLNRSIGRSFRMPWTRSLDLIVANPFPVPVQPSPRPPGQT